MLPHPREEQELELGLQQLRVKQVGRYWLGWPCLEGRQEPRCEVELWCLEEVDRSIVDGAGRSSKCEPPMVAECHTVVSMRTSRWLGIGKL